MNDNTAKADLYAHDLTGADWRKSPYSAGEGQCVEITDLPGGAIAVRDCKNPSRPALCFNAAEWSALRKGMIDGSL
ncbi:DUF397 domain-containing protein [Streptomyces sp. ISL-100]|uniref:DUF397 domain-containing protein n=1 Tax=Streptomyces sp. ISL-100 TaxID=2819173 RepID=UPI001BE503DA|nr:DUF397 domain-containing protein [Streptomyces sp. ISL-100]MBT2401952.1 DUF397 domain-containing protein [Streptomyces sp. ISL-100]